ncbi:hypothetical protein [Mucilaginibacter sp.]|jgi:hypothetical protein|uniref:hypothetical protein n=1 Tax=Mucilaginibacter sp. TaxID=1882438 RepID=UPI002CFB03F2|nr:hypothetical protein [Mucilaginibacter sp.]HTI60211.1 hypothetical protein [Mucilaginibacter sp.]
MSLVDLANTFRNQLSSGDTITLDSASLSSSGAVNIAGLISLMEKQLDITAPGSIAISGLQSADIPVPVRSLAIIKGTSTFLNTQLQVNNLVFTLDGSNNLDFYLEVTITDLNWTFGKSFPSGATFTELDGFYKNAEFIFSTYTLLPWPGHPHLSLKQGLNFYSELDLKDPTSPIFVLGAFLAFFSGGAAGSTPSLFGQIDIANTIQGDASQASLPTINLVTPNISQSADSFNLFGFLHVKNPRIAVKTITFEDEEPSS